MGLILLDHHTVLVDGWSHRSNHILSVICLTRVSVHLPVVIIVSPTLYILLHLRTLPSNLGMYSFMTQIIIFFLYFSYLFHVLPVRGQLISEAPATLPGVIYSVTLVSDIWWVVNPTYICSLPLERTTLALIVILLWYFL